MFPHLPHPLLFAADDFSSQDNLDDPEAGGWDATLVAEEEEEFFELQIVKHHDSEVREAAGQGNLVFSLFFLYVPHVKTIHQICYRNDTALVSPVSNCGLEEYSLGV